MGWQGEEAFPFTPLLMPHQSLALLELVLGNGVHDRLLQLGVQATAIGEADEVVLAVRFEIGRVDEGREVRSLERLRDDRRPLVIPLVQRDGQHEPLVVQPQSGQAGGLSHIELGHEVLLGRAGERGHFDTSDLAHSISWSPFVCSVGGAIVPLTTRRFARPRRIQSAAGRGEW
jgi:hypothetical protein